MMRSLTKGMALVALVGGLFAASASSAVAAPFVGQVDYTGTQTADNSNLLLATQVTIDSTIVVINTGSFSVIPVLSSFDNHSSPILLDGSDAPYATLWADSGINFSLDTLTQDAGGASDSITIRGTGTFTGLGLDPTPGDWRMTINNAGDVIGSFSASSAVSPVPEPASLALLGFGLAAAAAARRRRNA